MGYNHKQVITYAGLTEMRAYHPAMSFSASDTFATPHSRHVSYPKALCAIKKHILYDRVFN
jgi:hypothetical protein